MIFTDSEKPMVELARRCSEAIAAGRGNYPCAFLTAAELAMLLAKLTDVQDQLFCEQRRHRAARAAERINYDRWAETNNAGMQALHAHAEYQRGLVDRLRRELSRLPITGRTAAAIRRRVVAGGLPQPPFRHFRFRRSLSSDLGESRHIEAVQPVPPGAEFYEPVAGVPVLCEPREEGSL